MAEVVKDVHNVSSLQDLQPSTTQDHLFLEPKSAYSCAKSSMPNNNKQNQAVDLETLASPSTKPILQFEQDNATHVELKKELNERQRHGNCIFPFAAYVWEPQTFNSRVPLHWHKELELVRFAGGVYEISVDMHNVVIKEDAFMLLPGNIMHTFTLPAQCEESAIVFDPSMLSFNAYDEVQSEIFEPLLTSNIPLPPIITKAHPAFNRIDKLYRYCVRHGGTNNASVRLLIKAKLLEIIAIYHEYGLISKKEMYGQRIKTKQDKLKELLNYVDTHYAGPITIRDASLRLGVTDQYFCRYFRRVTGMSFTEYLNDLRLRRATKEIELTNRSISEIAYDHGFENAGYFFKNFKLKYGLTPLRYRKKFLKENEQEPSAKSSFNTALSPVDANHTSVMHDRDINTLMQGQLSSEIEPYKYTTDGLIMQGDFTALEVDDDELDVVTSSSSYACDFEQGSATATSCKVSEQPNNEAALDDDGLEYYEDEYEDPEHTKQIQETAVKGSTKDKVPFIPSSSLHVATAEHEIQSLLRTRHIGHLDASENEDELFEDDEELATIQAQPVSTIQNTNNPSTACKILNSGLQELAQSHSKGCNKGARKCRKDKGAEPSSQMEETENKKAGFVSPLNDLQSVKKLRKCNKSKGQRVSTDEANTSSSKSISSGITARASSMYALGSSFEDDEIQSSTELLRRSIDNTKTTEPESTKSSKAVNRAALRAKIEELENRVRNKDPFAI